ncbi:MAG TPA: hypothetical protein DCS93_40075 [Microscillaceae bacterium]|nr:hypothetical protein [Microscillaceae bacterium]
MGHRTNYILIENQEYDVYYAHWDANIIGRKLFYGPDSLIQYIRPLSVSEKLLDTIWAEGSVLVDIDKQYLLFWGDEFLWHNSKLVTYFIKMLQDTTWREWNIEWAQEGQVDVARYLNIDLKEVINELEDEDEEGNEEISLSNNKEYSSSDLADLLEQMLNNHLQNLDYDPTTTIRDIIKEHRNKGNEVSVNPHALEHENLNVEEKERVEVVKQLTDWIINLREGKITLP